MTLRDWFAGQAMAAMIAGGDAGEPYLDPDSVAAAAYEYADEMMLAREERT